MCLLTGCLMCPECGGILIHRDNRDQHESTSWLGQQFHDRGPKQATVCDVDLAVVHQHSDDSVLFRIVEDCSNAQSTVKNVPERPMRGQAGVLRLLARMFEFVKRCPEAPDAGLRLDMRSGVYIRKLVNNHHQIETLDGTVQLDGFTDVDLFGWSIGWPRHWTQRTPPISNAAKLGVLSADQIIHRLVPLMATSERKKLREYLQWGES
jgi:hypothetical protein